MNEKKSNEVQPTFLNDETILPWWDSMFRMVHPDQGSTKLVKCLGLESIDQEVGKYRIVASAAKHIADIGHEVSYKENATVVRELFFRGRIAIYEQGKMLDTKLDGWDIATEGFIWTSTLDEEIFRGSDGLRNLILSAKPTEDRIISIIQGYKIQAEQLRKAESKRESYNQQAARHQGQREGPIHNSGAC
jgi:hypothetical protein